MPAGRPTAYKPDYVEQAKKLSKMGATDAEMAEFFGVAISTLNLWKVKHPEFSEALSIGKEIADNRVVNSLYQRAMGYSHPDVDIRVVEGQVVQTELIKHYPPDSTAMIFWLKNRDPSNWRDKTDIEHSGSIAGLTDDQIEQKIRELTSKGE